MTAIVGCVMTVGMHVIYVKGIMDAVNTASERNSAEQGGVTGNILEDNYTPESQDIPGRKEFLQANKLITTKEGDLIATEIPQKPKG